MKEKREEAVSDFQIEKVIGVILNILTPCFFIVVMILIKDRIYSLVNKEVIKGIGYIFSAFTLILPFLARKIYIKVKGKKQAKMVVYVLNTMPLIFGFIYFLLGGELRYSITFALITTGYYLFAEKFICGGG